MNTSRVPGVTRNTGWRAVDAEIAADRTVRQPTGPTHTAATDGKTFSGS